MTRVAIWASATVALLTVSACTSTKSGSEAKSADASGQQCFFANNVQNFVVVNSETVNIRVGRDIYRLDMFGDCPNLTWTEGMVLRSTAGSPVCTGNGLGVSVVTLGFNGPQQCSVQSITLLTPEEVAALPARDKP